MRTRESRDVTSTTDTATGPDLSADMAEVNIHDEASWMTAMEASISDVLYPLAFKEGPNACKQEMWEFRYWRPDEVSKYKYKLAKFGWVQVARGEGIGGESFTDWFEDEVFDVDDKFACNRGKIFNVDTGKVSPDRLLFVRPRAAMIAERRAKAKIEAERDEKVRQRMDQSREQAETAGGKIAPGYVTTTNTARQPAAPAARASWG